MAAPTAPTPAPSGINTVARPAKKIAVRARMVLPSVKAYAKKEGSSNAEHG